MISSSVTRIRWFSEKFISGETQVVLHDLVICSQPHVTEYTHDCQEGPEKRVSYSTHADHAKHWSTKPSYDRHTRIIVPLYVELVMH